MDFDKEYVKFVQHITDPKKSGKMGPVKFSKEEDSFARLFVAYLNCRYASARLTSAMHSNLEAMSTPNILGWIKTQHMRCKKCGKMIECAGRIEWDIDVGVRAYGVCGKCGLMLIQYEKQSKNKWIKI